MKASVLFFMVLVTAAVSQSQQSGMYAHSATPIWDQLWSKSGKAQPVSIPSPNGSILLIASFSKEGNTGVQLVLLRHGKRIWSQMVSPGVGIEAGWAPDSTAFFVTTSGGGRDGFYKLAVHSLNQGTVSTLDLTPAIQEAFGHPVKCQSEEPPNVAAVKWMHNSRELIAVAELVAHSNCDSDGTFRAYRISLPEGRVIGSYDQIEAKRTFGSDLGWEIRNAPDRCVRLPKACWQPFNHNSTP
jgi:hypothetical protein